MSFTGRVGQACCADAFGVLTAIAAAAIRPKASAPN
jgi:hypothetical protein